MYVSLDQQESTLKSVTKWSELWLAYGSHWEINCQWHITFLWVLFQTENGITRYKFKERQFFNPALIWIPQT